MPDFLTNALSGGPAVPPEEVFVRLLVALFGGGVVAWIYRRTRRGTEITATFPVTLVLLAVLIAMVTQVIGDNVARAFSLVGALSIVRFRTVVRDTQDTAYVIFAVVVGMAAGASNLWVALIGLAVVGLAAGLMRSRPEATGAGSPAYLLHLRVALGQDMDTMFGAAFTELLLDRELVTVETARQGVSLDVTYETRLRTGVAPEHLIRVLNRVEGVQSVGLRRRGFEQE